MSEIPEIKCPNAVRDRKIIRCAYLNALCGLQRHCNMRGRSILAENAKTCRFRDKKPEK